MRTTWLSAGALAIAALISPRTALADDPVHLSQASGERVAALLLSQGALCLRATTVKRTRVSLDGLRTYRIACGPDGGAPIYLVTLPPGRTLRSLISQ